MSKMDDIIRQMLEEQYTPEFSGQSLYTGLLGENPTNSSANNPIGQPQQAPETPQQNAPMTVGGVDVNQQAQTTYTPGLLGETPASTQQMTPVNNNAQQALEGLTAKGQQVTQNMANMQQEANQQGAQAAQNLQAKRDSEMSNTEQQARQLLQQQQQQESGLGNLLGMGLKLWLTGGTGVWGKKK